MQVSINCSIQFVQSTVQFKLKFSVKTSQEKTKYRFVKQKSNIEFIKISRIMTNIVLAISLQYFDDIGNYINNLNYVLCFIDKPVLVSLINNK